jgi:hypothetical protein
LFRPCRVIKAARAFRHFSSNFPNMVTRWEHLLPARRTSISYLVAANAFFSLERTPLWCRDRWLAKLFFSSIEQLDPDSFSENISVQFELKLTQIRYIYSITKRGKRSVQLTSNSQHGV